jgi:Ni,Fe-hydrogenase I large subunit
MGSVNVAPLNRIEGHLDITATSDGTLNGGLGGYVTATKNKAMMFRGFENIMIRRDPRDAPIITQRACGVCPIAHGTASSKCVGNAFKVKRHYEDNDSTLNPWLTSGWGSEYWTDLPNSGRLLVNLALACNTIMSHILHFYHLVALDYVDVAGTGLIPKGFLCPNFDNKYYARGIDPLGVGGAVYTVNDINVGSITHGTTYLGDLTPYLAGQYVRALKARRMCHQIGALFAGKMPHGSAYTPGGITTKVYDPNAAPGTNDYKVKQKFEEICFGGPNWVPGSTVTHPLGEVQQAFQPNPGDPNISCHNPHPESLLGFIGKPNDFARWQAGGYADTELPLWAGVGLATPANAGTAWKAYTGTMLFDVVAAAHLFPEYFWIGTGYSRFLAWGSFEKAGPEGGPTYFYDDQRLNHRARTHVRQSPTSLYPGGEAATNLAIWNHGADHNQVREYTAYSWYDDDSLNLGRHPWATVTNPNPDNPAKPQAYSFAKAPRFINNESGAGDEELAHPNGDAIPYEVGPLARGYANLPGLSIPLTTAQLNAVLNGDRFAYYPGVLNHAGYGLLPDYGDSPPGAGAFSGLLYGAIPDISGYKSNYVGDATLDRIAARALETYYIAKHMCSYSWFDKLNPAENGMVTQQFAWGGVENKTAPMKSYGVGLTEAPRGALGHWMRVGKKRNKPNWQKFKGRVFIYQIITPTAWNVCPKDHNGAHGPSEECYMGTPIQDDNEPIELIRVAHSFDYCLACTVHVTNVKGEKTAKAVIEPSG